MNHRFAFQIEHFLQHLAAKRKAATTIASYRLHLFRFAGWKQCKNDVRTVDESIIDAYRRHIVSLEQYGSDWKLRALSSLKSFFAWLSLEGVILADPASKLVLPSVKSKRLPPYLTQDEIVRLIEAADPQTSAGLRDRAILETLYSTGMRASECYQLKIGDLFADGLARINSGKGRKDRIIPIGAMAIHFIQRYIAEARTGPLSGTVFQKPISGQPINAYDLRIILNRCGEKAGIGIHLYPHLLRHSFAVHLLEGGAGIREIQQMLGHENLVATQIYTRVVPVQLKKVHEAAHPAAKRKEDLPRWLDLQKYYRNTGERKGERRGCAGEASEKVLLLAAKKKKFFENSVSIFCIHKCENSKRKNCYNILCGCHGIL